MLNVAILGSGNIGTDLLVKTMRSPYLRCLLLAGRNNSSKGLAFAESLNVRTSVEGIEAIKNAGENIDLVFDATSASSHIKHSDVFKHMGVKAIDMTPSHIGMPVVPNLNGRENIYTENVNMVTCGGQTSIPIIDGIARGAGKMHSIEVVSSISSKSAGLATRENLDEYIENTEEAIREFFGVTDVKCILILNPAEPPVMMQTSVTCVLDDYRLSAIQNELQKIELLMNRSVPGYRIVTEPTEVSANKIFCSVQVEGRGDYLPSYAGNLDIINCAAIHMAELIAAEQPDVAAVS